MKGFLSVVVATALLHGVQAAWYWPFGSEEEEDLPRLSKLMEPASLAIDDAADAIADGKTDEAVEHYRKALAALERIEAENPERAATPEFATVRVKRAYVNAAIDSILLAQSRENAKAVAVTDTTELEKKFAAKRAAAAKPAEENAPKAAVATPKLEKQVDAYVERDRARMKKTEKAAAKAKAEKAVDREIKSLLKKDPKSRRARLLQAGEDIRNDDCEAAKLSIRALLEEKPNDAAALNMRAMCEAAEGDFRAAEKTLDQAINSNPRDHYAYYNMANLMLQSGGSREAARRYYETGRAVGGPKDEQLEKALK